MTTPSVGNIVHFQAVNGETQAAIVTRVENETLLVLTVFTGVGPNVFTAGYDGREDPSVNTWHWPRR